ncbi:unnamed protein product [Boreogadus saida]
MVVDVCIGPLLLWWAWGLGEVEEEEEKEEDVKEEVEEVGEEEEEEEEEEDVKEEVKEVGEEEMGSRGSVCGACAPSFVVAARGFAAVESASADGLGFCCRRCLSGFVGVPARGAVRCCGVLRPSVAVSAFGRCCGVLLGALSPAADVEAVWRFRPLPAFPLFIP